MSATLLAQQLACQCSACKPWMHGSPKCTAAQPHTKQDAACLRCKLVALAHLPKCHNCNLLASSCSPENACLYKCLQDPSKPAHGPCASSAPAAAVSSVVWLTTCCCCCPKPAHFFPLCEQTGLNRCTSCLVLKTTIKLACSAPGTANCSHRNEAAGAVVVLLLLTALPAAVATAAAAAAAAAKSLLLART
jgi:hypothetical protein